jgi:tetratricopeptide (TPR) repeat protein
MTYYYQAVSFEPALQAADGRLSQLTVQVSGGLGASVKNDIQARRDWLNLMKECAAFMRDHPPYELLYDPGVEQDGATDYAKETANFTMSIALAPSAAGFQVLNDLLAGLEKSGRRSVWGFEGWPFLPLNPAAPEALLWGGQRSFTAAGEAALVNADGKTLGRTRFTLTIGDIGFSAGAKSLAAPPPAAQVLRFAGVNANDLTDPLTVRILNVNGKTAEAAGEAGYMRIAADTAGIARRELRRVAEEQQRERDRQEAVKYNTSGLEYHNKKDYDRAIADYTQAIRLDPNDAAAYINRGSAYNDKGDYDRAITDLNQAIRLDPNDATAYNNRGFAYHNKKDYDRARADFTQAIRLNPNNDIYYNNRGNAYYSQRDYNSAIADYTTAIRLNPDSGILYSNRGDAYKNIKNLDSAIWDYEAALRLRPEDDSIRDKLVQAYCDRGYIFIIDWTGPPVSNADYNRFVTNYEAALRIKPNSKARNTFEFYKVEFQKQMRGEFKNVRDRPVGLPPTDNWWR